MATIHEVAAKAGVSAGTVSRYLNGYSVKPANAAKIDEAVAELKYRENFLARSLRLNKTMSVGVLINNMKSNFASSTIAAIQTEIEKHDYTMVLCGFKSDKDNYVKHLDTLVDRQVDGLFIVEGLNSWTPEEFLNDISIPVISINSPINSDKIDSYVTDDAWSCEQIILSMVEMGHKRIGVIVGSQVDFTSIQRLEGIQRAIKKSGINPDDVAIRVGDYTNDCGYKYASELMDEGYECIFVTNYNMGDGALQAIHERGYVIGKNFSFARYDYFATSPIFFPRITSVCPNVETMGTEAAVEMMDAIKNHRLCSGKRHIIYNTIKWNESIVDLTK